MKKKETTWKMHSRRIILKQTLSIIGGHGLDYRDDAGCFEHVNEYSSFINVRTSFSRRTMQYGGK